jgi:hypothetical protein
VKAHAYLDVIDFVTELGSITNNVVEGFIINIHEVFPLLPDSPFGLSCDPVEGTWVFCKVCPYTTLMERLYYAIGEKYQPRSLLGRS